MYLIITGISTHTLMWSVTDKTTLKGVVGKDFNSHAHVERDVFTNLDNRTIFISTHTLTWSVTPERCKIGKSDIEFQLTRSRGA